MRVLIHILQFGVAVTAGTLVSSAALAQDTSASAEVLFRNGARLLKAGQTDDACKQLEASYTLDPAIGTLGMLGYCHERQLRLATAWQEYLRVAAQARSARQTDREMVALERARAIEPRVSRLTLRTASAIRNVVVKLNQRRLLPEELNVALPMDGGTLTVEASRSGYEMYSTRIELPREGTAVVLDLPELAPLPPKAPATGTSTAIAAESRPREAPSRTNWPLLGAAGVAITGLGVGSYFGVRALSKSHASDAQCTGNVCSQEGVDLRDQALSSARVSTIGFVIAGAGAVSGAVIIALPYFRDNAVQVSVGGARELASVNVAGSLP